MKVGADDKKIIIAEIANDNTYQAIKALGFKWYKKKQTMEGPVNMATLSGLAKIIKLPPKLTDLLKRMEETQARIDRHRADPDPQPVATPPVKANLYKHQIRCLNMALTAFGTGQGFGLWLEMGTGKSLTSIAIAGALYKAGKIERVLVACPTSITAVWVSELAKFADFKHKATVLQGDKKKRLEALAQLQEWPFQGLKVAVINYESTHRLGIFEALKEFKADLIICDESQRIKNHAAAQSKAMHELGSAARYKLALSGTPIQNNAIDFFSQYKFLDPSIFGPNFYAFRNKFIKMGGFGGKQVIGLKNEEELIRRAHSIAYRVTKEECLDLPEQVFINRTIKLAPREQDLYNQVLRDSYAELDGGKEVTASTILVKLLRLQQLTGGFLQPDDGGRPVPANSAKLDALQDIIEDAVIDGGQKLVIFARFRAEIDAIAAMLKKLGVGYVKIDGDVPQTERGAIVDDFQNNPETKVFVAQIATAGLGITLTAASLAVFYSVGYNYAEYEQATARTHRVGQKNKCVYIHLLVENSVDEKVMAALENKEDIAQNLVDNWRRFFY